MDAEIKIIQKIKITKDKKNQVTEKYVVSVSRIKKLFSLLFFWWISLSFKKLKTPVTISRNPNLMSSICFSFVRLTYSIYDDYETEKTAANVRTWNRQTFGIFWKRDNESIIKIIV